MFHHRFTSFSRFEKVFGKFYGTHQFPLIPYTVPSNTSKIFQDERGRFNVFLDKEFSLQLGGRLPVLHIQWEQFGSSGPVIMIIPSLSSSSHVTSTEKDPSTGWWQQIVGDGKWIDTSRYRVIVANILGSPFGSSSAISTNPLTGKLYGSEFPQFTTADQAHVHKLLLEFLGIDQVKAVVGSSLGGMQAIQFGVHFPHVAEKLILISCTGTIFSC
eukprot:TRINITY_DN6182_c0_g1_i1.p1 TRINITY_DN6182_c0_g1~~TRINITY_DN6182_c0_g1_i1.p1  ORF type:complete len:215 (+),score=31.29 TRINITY_DN6182_c0_g1_i1:180-824(+)